MEYLNKFLFSQHDQTATKWIPGLGVSKPISSYNFEQEQNVMSFEFKLSCRNHWWNGIHSNISRFSKIHRLLAGWRIFYEILRNWGSGHGCLFSAHCTPLNMCHSKWMDWKYYLSSRTTWVFDIFGCQLDELCGFPGDPLARCRNISTGLLIFEITIGTWARFLSLARSKLRLCSANHRPGYWNNLPCDWPSTAWAYSQQETENGPWNTFDSNGLILIPAWIDDYMPSQVWFELFIHSQTSMVQPWNFGNGYILSSHTLWLMWLLIHAGN